MEAESERDGEGLEFFAVAFDFGVVCAEDFGEHFRTTTAGDVVAVGIQVGLVAQPVGERAFLEVFHALGHDADAALDGGAFAWVEGLEDAVDRAGACDQFAFAGPRVVVQVGE